MTKRLCRAKANRKGTLRMDKRKMCDFLKELRKERGVTQEQAAEELFVSAKTVSRWETGATIPDLETLLKLAEYYKVDIRDLIEGERKTPGENAEAEQNESLHAAARYAREKEKRTVFRLAMVFLGILALIIGINALIRAGQREKSLNGTETRRFYGKVTGVRQGLNEQSEVILDCDTFEAHIRIDPETRLDDSLKERILAHTEDLYLIVLCEYPARERYDAEKRQGIYVYPAYHITEWQKN